MRTLETERLIIRAFVLDATEAAAAMAAYAFDALRLRRIVATTEHDNTRSLNVMGRLGMRLEQNPQAEPHWFQTVGILETPPTELLSRGTKVYSTHPQCYDTSAAGG